MHSPIPELISTLCQEFYRQGWVSGTGGGISIREGDRIYMAPSGVQKERIAAEDIFVLDGENLSEFRVIEPTSRVGQITHERRADERDDERQQEGDGVRFHARFLSWVQVMRRQDLGQL